MNFVSGPGRVPQGGPGQPSGTCHALGDRNGGAEAQGQARRAWLRGRRQARGQGPGAQGVGMLGDGGRFVWMFYWSAREWEIDLWETLGDVYMYI